MPRVSNIGIKLQSGTDNTYIATWSFNETTTTTVTTSGIKAGSLVSIKSGATYYNGSHIPDWVKNQKWYLTQVKGDRAVLGKNQSGNHNICSPINVKNLIGGGNTSSTTTTSYNKTLDHYTVTWHYDSGDGIWFSGGSSDTTEKYASYSAPSNANRIRVTITPVSATHTVNNTEVAYWNGSANSKVYSLAGAPPAQPSTPSVNVEKYTLTASIDNISDARTDQIKFEVYNDTTYVSSGIATVRACKASYQFSVSAGGSYRVRCVAINIDNNSKIYGKYSDFSSAVTTIPLPPSGFTKCEATSKTSVRLEWNASVGAKTYDIEYSTKKEYFYGSDGTSTTTGISTTRYEKTGLESGKDYFFRVRAVNNQGESEWSEIKSLVLGTDPAAPTTWSSTTTAVTGEPLNLYWVHNSEDGSSQTYAELELTIDGETKTYTIKNTKDEDEKDNTSAYPIDTSKYTEGTTILWRVRTAGVTKKYGNWSIRRTVDIYAPATLTLTVKDKDAIDINILTSFPFYVSALAGPKTQSPISYHVSVRSNEMYETLDQVGNVKIVKSGEEVYSQYFDTSEALLVELSAHNIDLENEINYTLTCVVAMNSGLTAQESVDFTVQWLEQTYEPDAEIGIDEDSYSAYIRPYCVDEKGIVIEDAILSVYRRDYDGEFVEIGSELTNGANVYLTDPHPSLDYARYRIIATSKSTGSISYYDPPGYPIQCKSIILQWDEAWSSFNTSNSDEMVNPAWTGSLLNLPYNIDTSDNGNADVSLVEYIGRAHPTAYYGTQLGETATWNTDVPKDDEETIYQLRRLKSWLGDVYVREPSGSGYWASVKVSFSRTHCEGKIPVTLDITRVEGGV